MAKKEGTLVIMMLGLFWIAGIAAAVLYSMTAHIYDLVVMREVQNRYWYALEGSLQTALANLNDNPAYYRESRTLELLYEGQWEVDPRHADLTLSVICEPDNAPDRRILQGTLSVHTKPSMIIAWHIVYDEAQNRWRYAYAEHIATK